MRPGRSGVLIVEDNPGDAMLIQEALKDTGLAVDVTAVPSGEDGLAFLRGEGRFGVASRPDLVVLDLNLPRMDGREFLACAGDLLAGVPVVVLSGEPGMARHLATRCTMLAKPGTIGEYDAMAATLKGLLSGDPRPPS
jgi:CheY-like chemotaxis protein